eukprot:TRINITY_DN3722_c0_g1_i2.p1 TRINITY_DN3722_c0_g1~~TRINITY_DN3722_c0_g1_i2.p1  ORF type:complete len:452 (-),score=70.09 TRINITY_DN3722_c0_g1_i2:917-2272(-)
MSSLVSRPRNVVKISLQSDGSGDLHALKSLTDAILESIDKAPPQEDTIEFWKTRAQELEQCLKNYLIQSKKFIHDLESERAKNLLLEKVSLDTSTKHDAKEGQTSYRLKPSKSGGDISMQVSKKPEKQTERAKSSKYTRISVPDEAPLQSKSLGIVRKRGFSVGAHVDLKYTHKQFNLGKVLICKDDLPSVIKNVSVKNITIEQESSILYNYENLALNTIIDLYEAKFTDKDHMNWIGLNHYTGDFFIVSILTDPEEGSFYCLENSKKGFEEFFLSEDLVMNIAKKSLKSKLQKCLKDRYKQNFTTPTSTTTTISLSSSSPPTSITINNSPLILRTNPTSNNISQSLSASTSEANNKDSSSNTGISLEFLSNQLASADIADIEYNHRQMIKEMNISIIYANSENQLNPLEMFNNEEPPSTEEKPSSYSNFLKNLGVTKLRKSMWQGTTCKY